MKIILDKQFITRPELDAFVLSRFGDDQKENIKHEIEVSKEEAEQLGLSDKVKVYGMRVLLK